MVNAFSFCLFGVTSGIYHRGFLENVDMIKRHFPGWVIYAYLGADTEPGFRNYLLRDPVIRVRDTGILGFKNTVHRFYAIDEPDVDVCMFRDADSRVHWKDRWAIREFMRSSQGAHIIRDHVHHTAMIAAGMWGLRRDVLGCSMRMLFDEWTPVFAGNGSPHDVEGVGIDQNFLVRCVYNRIRDNFLLHYSNDTKFEWERGVEFPFLWSSSIYCGRFEDSPYTDSNPPTIYRPPSVFTKLSR
jgi:hypothetical protein